VIFNSLEVLRSDCRLLSKTSYCSSLKEELVSVDIEMQCRGLVMTRLVVDIRN